MAAKRPIAKNIDEYILGFPPEVQQILEKLRATIKKAAPAAFSGSPPPKCRRRRLCRIPIGKFPIRVY